MAVLQVPAVLATDRKSPEGDGPPGSRPAGIPAGEFAGEHEPVLVRELVEGLAGVFEESQRGLFVDGTLGAAGHASAVLARFPKLELLGFDHDEDSLALAERQLAPFGGRVRTRRARLSELSERLAGEEAPQLALVDLGVCSIHLDRADRGFSFASDGPLDMRMDRRRETTAADILATWDEQRLADLIYHEGGERRSRPIARAICEARRRAPFLRTAALADLISRTVTGKGGPGGGPIHPATKTFQALRRAVNQEGAELEQALLAFESHLAPGGVLAVISFHSGEDGVVKRFLKRAQQTGTFEALTRKPLGPARDEVRRNARSRSARLRLARRTDQRVGVGDQARGSEQ